jgi:excisionase family DNA binding protein
MRSAGKTIAPDDVDNIRTPYNNQGMNMATINTSDFLTTAEAAQSLGLAIDSVTAYCNQRKLGAVKVGYIWLIPKTDIRKFKEKRRLPGRPKGADKKS